MFERINLRLGESITARNELGVDKNENWRENATMLYGEIRPNGHFRFVDFGHPLPLVFSAEYKKLVDIGKARIVHYFIFYPRIRFSHLLLFCARCYETSARFSWLSLRHESVIRVST